MNIRNKLLLEIGVSLVLFFGVAGLGIIMRLANGMAEKGIVLIMVVASVLFLAGCFLVCVAVRNGVGTKKKNQVSRGGECDADVS